MALVKICGLRTEKDAAFVNEAWPDFAGFICSQGFRRSIDLRTAARLRRLISGDIVTVGVFVDDSQEKILKFLESGAIGAVQLHGSESDEYIDELKSKTEAVIVKAFVIRSADDINRAAASHADIVLLDSGKGSGREFDEKLIGNFPREYFLAGGMNAETVREKIKRLNPFAVDVSSGVETDGAKDRNKMIKFVQQVRER